MPGFTHICEKINLHILDNVLTVYYNDKPDEIASSSEAGSVYYPEASILFNEFDLTPLGVTGFIHHENGLVTHYQYEEFGPAFSSDKKHCHAKFAQQIDKTSLQSILQVFCAHHILSQQEANSIFHAFQLFESHCIQINVLKEQQFQLVSLLQSMQEQLNRIFALVTRIQPVTQPTSYGLRFFDTTRAEEPAIKLRRLAQENVATLPTESMTEYSI